MSGDQDLLERATRALREATPPTQDELAAGRARLLAAHRVAQKSSRARTLRWVLPLAAVLAAGSALAATPEAFERLAAAVSSMLAPDATKLAKPKAKRSSERVATSPSAAPRPQPAPAPAPSPKTPLESAPLASADTLPEVATAASPAPAGRRHRHAPRAASTGAEPVVEQTPPVQTPAPVPEAVTEPESDGDLASYRAAHRSHFRLRDYGAALRAWNDYLLEYPRGTFAVEARYNRAICLVRLGQKDEARKALTPFARGEVAHGYRQAEANKLLEALE